MATDDVWAPLVERFAGDAYATVKGAVRTFVLDRQLREHLPPPPARVLDVGGGAGHQSFPLAEAGYEVVLLDSSAAMLERARERLASYPDAVARRVAFVQASGEDAVSAVGGERFSAVLCHGVIGYLDDPAPLIDQLCACVATGGIVSIMTTNRQANAVKPALERRWSEALTAFDAERGIGVLGLPGRADTPEGIGDELAAHGVLTERWYGAWLFVDWLDFAGVELDVTDTEQLSQICAVELEASGRDPYRGIARAFHVIGRSPAK